MMPAEEQRNLTLGEECEFIGRLVPEFADEPDCILYVDTWASRFTAESIAGLVVGAMGVFVFTVALRQWLKERRRPTGPSTA